MFEKICLNSLRTMDGKIVECLSKQVKWNSYRGKFCNHHLKLNKILNLPFSNKFNINLNINYHLYFNLYLNCIVFMLKTL